MVDLTFLTAKTWEKYVFSTYLLNIVSILRYFIYISSKSNKVT